MDRQAEAEGQAIRRLLRLAPRNIGANPHAILWNTIARESTVRDAMMVEALAKTLVWHLKCKAAWREHVRRVTSSANRSKGNARRRAKRGR